VYTNDDTLYVIIDYSFDPIYLDNCEIKTVWNSLNKSNTLYNAKLSIGVYNITWIISDAARNQVTRTFTVEVRDNPTKISDLLNEGISVYPNPAINRVYIKSDTKNIKRLVLSSSVGQVINVVNVNNNKSTLDMSGLNKGLYILTIETDENVYSTKLIKN